MGSAVIGDDLAQVLPELRDHAESLMRDTCTVHRPTDVLDPITGEATTVQVYPDPLWPEEHRYAAGPCKVQTYEGYERTPEAGGHQFTVQRYRVDFPATAFLPKPGDVVTIVTAATDPALVGKWYRVAAPFNKSLATANRCFVDEIVA